MEVVQDLGIDYHGNFEGANMKEIGEGQLLKFTPFHP
jgi:hypothetical protein